MVFSQLSDYADNLQTSHFTLLGILIISQYSNHPKIISMWFNIALLNKCLIDW